MMMTVVVLRHVRLFEVKPTTYSTPETAFWGPDLDELLIFHSPTSSKVRHIVLGWSCKICLVEN